MTNQELIYRLNQNNNFHLSLKVIQFTDNKIAKEFATFLTQNNKKSVFVSLENELYDELEMAYKEKIEYVICDSSISFFLPLVSVITNDNVSIIKPIIPVLYYLKDNKIIQKVKTACNKKMTTYTCVKTKENLFDEIIKNISN